MGSDKCVWKPWSWFNGWKPVGLEYVIQFNKTVFLMDVCCLTQIARSEPGTLIYKLSKSQHQQCWSTKVVLYSVISHTNCAQISFIYNTRHMHRKSHLPSSQQTHLSHKTAKLFRCKIHQLFGHFDSKQTQIFLFLIDLNTTLYTTTQ
jgi:hypothetical protein